MVNRVKNTFKIQKNKDESPDIFKKYQKWKHFFQKKIKKNWPKHQPYNHEILFEKNKKPKFGPIYKFSTKELDVLRNYIDKNFRKKIIPKSKSPTKSPILFGPKKNGKSKFYVDYKIFNNIIMKNRYLLSNINALQDRFGNAKNFTNLNLRNAYNLIRIKNDEK